MTDRVLRPLANRQGQPLAEHAVLVARVTRHLILTGYGGSSTPEQADRRAEIEQVAATASVAALLHDIGKLDPLFQQYMRSSIDGEVPDETIEDGEHIPADHGDGHFSFDTYPRHEEVGWLLFRQLFDHDALRAGPLGGDPPSSPSQQSRLDALGYAVYWHHARPARYRPEIRSAFATAERLEDTIGQRSSWLVDGARAALERFLDDVDTLAGTTLRAALRTDLAWRGADEGPVPAFKANYVKTNRLDSARPGATDRAVQIEMRRTLVRSALVSADRLVSRLTPAELFAHLADGTLPTPLRDHDGLSALYGQIERMIARFEKDFPGNRTDVQAKAADDLAALARVGRPSCLQGPAGCGKTNIALQFLGALDERRKVVVFVPRTAIGEGLFEELVNEYGITANVEYLAGSAKRIHRAGATEAIETPPSLERTGDVLITTIDQLCGAMLSHERIDFITALAGRHVIVDEVHELAEIPGIVALFLEAMHLRRLSNAATLLVSATPNPALLERLGLAAEDVVRVPTFNTRPYRIFLHELESETYARGQATRAHPIFDTARFDDADSVVVCNTATLAQQAAIVHRESGREVLCLHGRFTPHDKRRLLRRALERFGKGSPETETLLVAGPIVQASLNLSSGDLRTEATHAENLLQRLGRLNRFGERERASLTVYVARDPVSGSLGNAGVLEKFAQRARAEAFIAFLHGRVPEVAAGRREITIRLDELYGWYDEFHESVSAREAWTADFAEVLTRSREIFEHGEFDPVQHPGQRRPVDDEGPRLAASSLRGRSSYVLPVALDVSDPNGPAARTLLWNGESPASRRLTDDLRTADVDERVAGHYLGLSNKAATSTVIDPVLADPSDRPFLKALGRRLRSVRTWRELASRASRPDTPVLVTGGRPHPHDLYYVRYRGVSLGLMRPSAYDAVAPRPVKHLMRRETNEEVA